MKKRKMKKKPLIILLVIVLIIVVVCAYFLFFKGEEKDPAEPVKNVDTIEAYGYNLSDKATKYYKDLFKDLKGILASKDFEEEEYASLVAKLFVTDFFNLDNKISKNDIGGLQYVYEPFRNDFSLLASTSIYKSVESDVYGERSQTLPVVSSVLTEKQDNITFKYGDNTDDNAYVYKFTITYADDLDYQKTGTVTLIHNNHKLEVAAME